MPSKILNKQNLLYFLILVYVSGSIGFCLYPTFFAPFTPFTLLFTCFVFILHQSKSELNYKFIFYFIVVALFGYISEVVGVKTGLVFGNYQYGNGLGMKFFKVPLVISFNWALMACAAIIVAQKFFSHSFLIAIIAASIATLIDVLIEQVAPKLDFWKFDSSLAGWHNYTGWFLISFVASLVFQKQFKGGNFNVSVVILALLILFFGIIYLFS